MVICSYQHDSVHPGLQIQEIYSEMSHLTHGVTQLGNYTLDKDSLYVNGERGLCFPRGCLQSFFISLAFSKSGISVKISCLHVLRFSFKI